MSVVLLFVSKIVVLWHCCEEGRWDIAFWALQCEIYRYQTKRI